MKDPLYIRTLIDKVDEIEALARGLARASAGKLFKRINGNRKPAVYRCGKKDYKVPAWKLAQLERRGFLTAPTRRALSFRVHRRKR